MTTRRAFLGFLAAAPFIVKASSLMSVRALAGAGDGVALFSVVHPVDPMYNNLVGAELNETSLLAAIAELKRQFGTRPFVRAPMRIIPPWLA